MWKEKAQEKKTIYIDGCDEMIIECESRGMQPAPIQMDVFNYYAKIYSTDLYISFLHYHQYVASLNARLFIILFRQ